MIALTKAIYSVVKNNPVLWGLISGKFYEDEAPQDTRCPYVVYSIISEVPDPTFTEKYEQYRIQFSVFSESSSSLETKTIMDSLKTAFDDCHFLTESGEVVSSSRISAVLNSVSVDTPTGTGREWQGDIDYQMLYLRVSS